MRKRVPAFALTTFITFTLLFRALAVDAQNFSLSLDADSSVGDQEAASVTTSADRIVAIQIFGSGINFANGISVYLEYDAFDVTYERFDAGRLFPNQQVFEETGTNPTYVGIAIGALGGQTTVDSGLLGTVHFRTAASFTGGLHSPRAQRPQPQRGNRVRDPVLDSHPCP